MINVAGNDGAPGRHLVPYEFRRDGVRKTLPPVLSRVLVIKGIARDLLERIDFGRSRHVIALRGGIQSIGGIGIAVVARPEGVPAQIFADGNEFHLGRDNALPCIPELGDGVVGGTERFAFQARVLLQPVSGLFVFVEFASVLLGEVAIVLRALVAAFIFLPVTTGQDPLPSQSGESFGHFAAEVGISPGAGAIIGPDGLILFDPAVRMIGFVQGDLTKRHAEVGMERALEVDAIGRGKEAFPRVVCSVFFGADHDRLSGNENRHAGPRGEGSWSFECQTPCVGMTRIRFGGCIPRVGNSQSRVRWDSPVAGECFAG